MEIVRTMVKKYKTWTLISGLILLFIIFIGILMITKQNNEFKMDMEVIKENKNNYNIQINYPVFNNKKLNKKVSKIIETEKKNFKDKIKNDNTNNELNIDYGYTIKDNIYSVHIRTYSYTGENNDYYHKDVMMYIDSKINKEIEKDVLVKNEIYQNIKDDCKRYLVNNKTLKLYEDSVVNEALDNLEDFALLNFSQSEMYVVIPPYKVSDSEIDININIAYDRVKNYLNSDYFTFDGKTTEENVSNTVSSKRDLSQFKDKK